MFEKLSYLLVNFAGFPEGHSNIQRYRVLGNSLNVHVVSVLIKLLIMSPPGVSQK